MPVTIRELLTENRGNILRIASEHGARNLRLFGSVARGEERAGSDIDLLVEFDADRSLLDHVALVQDLEELLGKRVHVTTKNALHWYIRESVLGQAVLL